MAEENWFGQADQLLHDGKWDEAITLLSTVIPALENKKSKVSAHKMRGDALNEKGEHDRAIADFDAVIGLDPNHAVAYNNRGYAYNEKGEYGRAIEDLSTAIDLNPDYDTAYNNRGYAYTSKGEYDRAIADYTRAIDLGHDAVTAYSNRSSAYHAKGNYDLAIDDLEQALRQAPKENRPLISSLIAGIKQAIQEREVISKELKSAAGFETREREHDNARKCAGWQIAGLLALLFLIYAVAFDWLIRTKNEALEILPWVPVIFLFTSPIIWAIRILNREKTRHFVLRENAYAHRLMNRLLFDKPKDEHGKEMAKKFFDHHDQRGTAQVIIALEKGQKPDDGGGGAVEQVVNTAKEGAKNTVE